MGSQAVVKGDIAKAVALNVSAIRGRRGLSQQALAANLAALGRPLQSTAIAKIEKGDRRVDVDDLVALAAALNVTPARLLLPDEEVMEPVRITPECEVPSYAAWHWATGNHSLLKADHDLLDPDVQRQELAFADERPVWLRTVEQHPLHRAVKHLEWAVGRALASRSGTPRGPKHPPASGVGVAPWLNVARKSLAEVDGQIDELADEVSDGQR